MKKLPDDEKRTKRFLVSATEMERSLMVAIAKRLGYARGKKDNLALALREEFLNKATAEEINAVLEGIER